MNLAVENAACFDGTSRAPVDRCAAMLMAKGVKCEYQQTIANPHWEICPPLRKPTSGIDLTGVKQGRLTVMGLLDAPRRNPDTPAKWIVRCACGDYETRSAKAIRNPANFGDRCIKCRKVAFIRRSYEFQKYGRDLDARTL